jgi:hypothetical protein
MSVIEDTRKVLQDFLAPELRSIHSKLDAVHELLGAQEKVMEARFHELTVLIQVTNDRIDGLKSALDLERRMERLENRQLQNPS